MLLEKHLMRPRLRWKQLKKPWSWPCLDMSVLVDNWQLAMVKLEVGRRPHSLVAEDALAPMPPTTPPAAPDALLAEAEAEEVAEVGVSKRNVGVQAWCISKQLEGIRERAGRHTCSVMPGPQA
jgi:hypothetical protein